MTIPKPVLQGALILMGGCVITGCATAPPPPHVSRTTTKETTIQRRPATTTVETQAYRTYWSPWFKPERPDGKSGRCRVLPRRLDRK